MNEELLTLIHKMKDTFKRENKSYEIFDSENIMVEKKSLCHCDRKECHYCGGDNINKNGKTKQGRQRYICKECGKSFSDMTGSPLSYTKKPVDKWIKYTLCIKAGFSLRKIAEILEINLTTSFHWRHKILSVAGTKIMNKKLSGTIEIDEVGIKESFKGNHSLNKKFSIVKSDKDKYIQNNEVFKREKIMILNCKDTSDNKFIKPVAKRNINLESLEKFLKPILKEDCNCLATPSNYKYYYFTKAYGLKLSMHGAINLFKGITTNISGIDNKIAAQRGKAFKLFLRSFHNVASKYLGFYINWFVMFIVEDNQGLSLFRKFVKGKKQLRVEDFKKVNFRGDILRNKRADERLVFKIS